MHSGTLRSADEGSVDFGSVRSGYLKRSREEECGKEQLQENFIVFVQFNFMYLRYQLARFEI
jgi:hypothetical protein